jgi:hypothetical protein
MKHATQGKRALSVLEAQYRKVWKEKEEKEFKKVKEKKREKVGG